MHWSCVKSRLISVSSCVQDQDETWEHVQHFQHIGLCNWQVDAELFSFSGLNASHFQSFVARIKNFELHLHCIYMPKIKRKLCLWRNLVKEIPFLWEAQFPLKGLIGLKSNSNFYWIIDKSISLWSCIIIIWFCCEYKLLLFCKRNN